MHTYMHAHVCSHTHTPRSHPARRKQPGTPSPRRVALPGLCWVESPGAPPAPDTARLPSCCLPRTQPHTALLVVRAAAPPAHLLRTDTEGDGDPARGNPHPQLRPRGWKGRSGQASDRTRPGPHLPLFPPWSAQASARRTHTHFTDVDAELGGWGHISQGVSSAHQALPVVPDHPWL